MSIRVLIVDDHAIVRHGLCQALGRENDMYVAGQASDGREAIALAIALTPDVVVTDISMPNLNGIEATRLIRAGSPQTKVIALSMHATPQYLSAMFRAGASGYLMKDCDFDELVAAIRRVAAGGSYVSPVVSQCIIQSYVQAALGPQIDAFAVLTGREREILQLIAEGHAVRDVAQRLHLSPKTIEGHRLRIMGKLGIDSIARLTKYAIAQGLTSVEI